MPVNRVSKVSSPGAAAKTAAARVKLSQVKSSDSGLKVKSTATGITMSGVARGPVDVSPSTGSERGPSYLRSETRGANVSFAFDHDAMPQFDTSAGFNAKNKWYFAHVADVPVTRGQTPEAVLNALAAKVNAQPGYSASVTARPDGSATLTVTRKPE